MVTEQYTLEVDAEPATVNRIRVETALSRFPIHRLAKKDLVTIDLQQSGDNGDPDFKWEVTYTQKHGQPGPLAYKVDTLIVNRRIDDAGRPLPGTIKLGSLTELCGVLGLGDSGENRSNIKRALHQNASAYITAKIRYRTKTGKERWGEIGYSRYSVVFTGEMLPDGMVADAVYIVPNTSYRDLLNQVEVRPLDYDYLTTLTPGAQRFYELLSYQIYGALAGGRPRAKMRYSEYCSHAPQNRYFDFDRVKKQMFKIHAPHREAGYIVKIDYEPAIDADGAADWDMFYTPGPKAVVEYEAFTNRQLRRAVDHVAQPTPLNVGVSEPEISDAAGQGLLGELTKRGINERVAKELLGNLQPGQEVMDQLEYVDSIVAKDSRNRLENPPGLYITHVRDNVPLPADFPTSRKRQLREIAQRHKQESIERMARLKEEYEAYCVAETARYVAECLPSEERDELMTTHRLQTAAMLSHLTDGEIGRIAEGTVRSEIRHSGRVPLLTFEKFAESKHAVKVTA